MPERGYVLAFDFGLKHIGVAVGQSVTQTASGLTTLAADNGTPDWIEIDRLITQWRPTQLLVGLPLNMDDSESDMSLAARAFADLLGSRSALPVSMVDERLTSFAAKQLSPGQNHEVAAALIAEGWLQG